MHDASSDIPPEALTTTWLPPQTVCLTIILINIQLLIGPQMSYDPYMTAYSTSAAQEQSHYPTTSAEGTPMPPTMSEGTPIPTSMSADNSPWPVYSRPPLPEFVGAPNFTLPPPPTHFLPSFHGRSMSSLENRPRSSPSTFGPSAESINWPDPRSVFGLHYPEPPTLGSNFASVTYHPIAGSEIFASPSPPEIKAPTPLRRYPTLAPTPASYNSKRARDDDEDSSDQSGKRRKRTCSVASADLSEDDRLLVTLKEDEGLPWKDIAARFGSHHGKTFQVAALQMRYKRLREKFRVWQGEDVEALKLAYEYWDKYKWDIISSKVSPAHHTP